MSLGAPRRAVHRRRRLLAALSAPVLVGVGVTEARRHWPGDVRTGAPAAHGATIERYTVRSRFVTRTLPQVAAIPRGASRQARRPLLVFLRGRDYDGEESNANAAFFAALGIPMRQWQGEHEGDYRRAHFAGYLRIYADALEAC